MLNGSARWISVPALFFPLHSLSLSLHVGRNDGRWGYTDGFQGRKFILFLLTPSQMRNRYCYFKTSPYLNHLLPFPTPPRLICRSVAEGFSLMTLLGCRSESRHISPFLFPTSLSHHFFLFLPITSSHLPPVLIPTPETQQTPCSDVGAKMPVDVVSGWPEAWRYTARLIEDEVEGKRGISGKEKV